MILFETNAQRFWNNVREHYRNKIGNLEFALIFLSNYGYASAELGLKFLEVVNDKHGIITSGDTIRFQVIDKQKFFLAKIKYAI